MANAWDIPPLSIKGDAEANTIFTAVGRALTSWETLEETLAGIFAYFVAAETVVDYNSPAIRAYGSIAAFSGRKDMLDAAAKAFFHKNQNDADYAEYTRLIKLACLFSPRRNEIAHGRVVRDFELTVSGASANHGHFLFPSSYMARKNPIAEAPVYKYTSRQIANFTDQFEELADKVAHFCWNLRQNAPPRP